MIFNSIQFIIFFSAVVLIYYLLPQKAKIVWLLLMSYSFYMYWNVKYIVCLLFVTISTYTISHLFKISRHKRRLLLLGICSNFMILFLFKYTSFAIDNINSILEIINVQWQNPFDNIILPVGISFYMFQAVGYLIDVYTGKIEAESNFVKYALFVSFFPLILSGPIEKGDNLLVQLKKIPKFSVENIKNGALLMAYGYFLKLVIADRACIVVDSVYSNYAAYSGIILFVASILFSIQIYCDFCGYSLIAVGTAEILGFKIINNFEQPYFAVSVQDFWRRWHISLSSWFRDYVYIPLGGSRCSRFRRYLNLFITFCISGLWHGANWTFVVWGGVNGILQIIGHSTKKIRNGLKRFLKIKTDCFSYELFQKTMTFLLINMTWVIFKSNNIRMAFSILRDMWKLGNAWVLFEKSLLNLGLELTEWIILSIAIVILWGVDLAHEKGISLRQKLYEQNLLFRWLVYVAMIMVILIWGVYGPRFQASEFIYFQF